MATAFSSQGATPNSLVAPSSATSAIGIGSTQTSTPQSNALNAMAQPSAPQIGPSSLAMLQAGGTPKSQTITTPDGSTHAMTYATPPVQTNASAPVSGMLGTSSNPAPSSNSSFVDPLGVTPAQAAAGQALYGSGNPGLISNPSAVSSAGVAPQGNQGGVINTAPATTNPTTSSGLLGTALSQEQGYLNSQEGLTQQIQGIDTNFANQEAALGEGYTGLGSQTPNQYQGLENIKNNAVAAVAGQQATQAGYEQPLAATYNAGVSALEPNNQSITAPAGGVTTNTATGQQYSNPILGPIGSQQFYSPQPGGTPNQPPTAGQATQYAIKAGDTFYSLANGDQAQMQAIEAANPGVDPNNLQVGQKINMPAQSQGSPFTAGVVAGQQQLGTQYAQNYSAYQQAEAIRGNINSIITSNPNLNPSQFTDINSALSFLNGKVSNPAYAVLANNVAEYVNTLAPILGVGGDTTNYKTQLAQQFLQGAASGQSMSQIMSGIAQTAALKLQQQQSAGGTTGSVTPQGNSSSGSSVTAGGYTFVQNAQGQWVAQ